MLKISHVEPPHLGAPGATKKWKVVFIPDHFKKTGKLLYEIIGVGN